MIRSMYSAISAMTLHQTYMDTVADNLANVNTSGFKSSTVLFQDLFAQIMSPGAAPSSATGIGGINPTQIGLGLKLGYVSADFSQGTLNATGRTSDLAIQGDGFFIFSRGDGGYLYGREGSLQIDSAGYLVNASTGLRLQGWNVKKDQYPSVDPNRPLEDLAIELNKNVAKATSNISLTGNLMSTTDPLDAAARAAAGITDPGGGPVAASLAAPVDPDTTGPFTLANANIHLDTEQGTYYDVTISYYDSLGQSLTTTLRYTRIYGDGDDTDYYGPIAGVDPEDPTTPGNLLAPICSTWAVDIAPGATGLLVQGPDSRLSAGTLNLNVDGTFREYDIAGGDDLHLCTVTFDNDGQVRRVNGLPIAQVNSNVTGIDSDNDTIIDDCSLPILVIPGDSGASSSKIAIDMSNLSQLYATNNTVSLSERDGVSPGSVSDIFVSSQSGEVYILYSNGEREQMGRIGMAFFTNPTGLLREGGSLYREGINSGPPQVGFANTMGRGTINPGYLEGSNVDMGQEFTNMILAQRGFQASSRVIRTSDQMLQELVNLKS